MELTDHIYTGIRCCYSITLLSIVLHPCWVLSRLLFVRAIVELAFCFLFPSFRFSSLEFIFLRVLRFLFAYPLFPALHTSVVMEIIIDIAKNDRDR